MAKRTTPRSWQIPSEYGGNYAITPQGEIYRLTIWGKSRRIRKDGPKLIKPIPHFQNGYHTVNLYDEGTHYFRYVHKLVAEAFLPPAPSPDHVLHHEDENRQNNHYRNLEWMLMIDHIMHHITPLIPEDIREIRRVHGLIPSKKLAALYGVSRSTIYKIHARATFKHIT